MYSESVSINLSVSAGAGGKALHLAALFSIIKRNQCDRIGQDKGVRISDGTV